VKDTMLVAVVAAWPPTLAAVLSFVIARSSDRRAAQERAAVTDQRLDHLGTAIGRVEATVERVDTGVGDLRERVARLEGTRDAQPAA
jgi:outer membrane murein-binding lipoprotein Lpp